MNNKIKIVYICFLVVINLLFASCNFLWNGYIDESYSAMFDALWRDYNETYALFDVRQVDWDASYNKYKPLIDNCNNDKEFFNICSQLLYELKDAHVYIKTPFDSMNSGDVNTNPEVFSLKSTLENYITEVKKCGNEIITYGRVRSDTEIGYIHVCAFNYGQTEVSQNQNWASEIDIALEELKDTKAIILDIRGNRGGLTGNVSRISGRFCAEEKTYAISRTKNGPDKNDLGPEVELTIRKKGNWQYTKPVMLLTNAQTMSAGEEFTLALVSQPHVVHIGSPTCGVFSLSLERCLPNGWKYSVSVQYVTDGNGICHEGKGIAPASENLIRNLDVNNDLQFERAFIKCH